MGGSNNGIRRPVMALAMKTGRRHDGLYLRAEGTQMRGRLGALVRGLRFGYFLKSAAHGTDMCNCCPDFMAQSDDTSWHSPGYVQSHREAALQLLGC